ncbi:two-component system regulatory protein YycI [Jeotgalibacillus sp. R-1-5s-1]|uniref:two-component system regulatory protein YycI n=1 Tax=Jeotgalibacillus sp. R-1-5s-1 TaxID=2555897 RepID=UPI00141BBB65|nr:two-component system regulatory protein YycI [Jeotgalibacillus sp. R-1-5s-1]
MDWSKTKTIFIVVFLILDVFLFFLFLQKYQDTQNSQLPQLSIADQIEEENITISSELPDLDDSKPYLNAESYRFSAEEVSNLAGQNATVRNNRILESSLNTPVDIEDPENPEELTNLLEEFVLYGEQYRFRDYREEENEIVYFQYYEDSTLYFNVNAQLVVTLNDQQQAVSYTQTYLSSLETFSTEQELITPGDALESFYGSGVVEANSRVTNLEIGYFPSFLQAGNNDDSVTGDVQVLTPTYKMTIENGEGSQRDLFINAVDDNIYDMSQVNLDFDQLDEQENDESTE